MAYKMSIDKHHVCFPTKVLSSRVGRTLNIVINEPTDNGTVVGKGDYVSFDQYEAATAPSGFEGEILEQAADGNWYVEVKKVDVNDPAVLIYEKPILTAENYDSRFKSVANFYNEASPSRTRTVMGYVLTTTDVYELSPDAFDTTDAAIAPGKKVTISGQKHKVNA